MNETQGLANQHEAMVDMLKQSAYLANKLSPQNNKLSNMEQQ
jgi:hypothetical protein